VIINKEIKILTLKSKKSPEKVGEIHALFLPFVIMQDGGVEAGSSDNVLVSGLCLKRAVHLVFTG
jgi:hypothetical protein